MTHPVMQPVRQTRLRHWVRRLLLAGAVAFIGLNGLAWMHAHTMMTYAERGTRTAKPEELKGLHILRTLFTGITLPRPHGTATPRDLGLAYTDLTLTVPQGPRLAAWHTKAQDAKGLVVLFHGYGSDKSSLLTEVAAFHGLGYATLAVDFRGSGGSSESYTTVGYLEAEDVATAVRYAREELQPPRLVLFGRSMGAAGVLRDIDDLDVETDALIIEAVFDSMLNTICNRFDTMRLPSFPSAQLLVFWGGVQAGFNGFAHNPRDYARAVKCPTLLHHGRGDPRSRLEDAHRVYAAIPATKELKLFPEAGHESYAHLQPEAWQASVSTFLASL